MCLGQTSRQSPLQSVYSYAGSHHATAANGLESLRPCEACSLSDVTVEGNRPPGSFRRIHLRIWLGDQRGISCPIPIKPIVAGTV